MFAPAHVSQPAEHVLPVGTATSSACDLIIKRVRHSQPETGFFVLECRAADVEAWRALNPPSDVSESSFIVRGVAPGWNTAGIVDTTVHAFGSWTRHDEWGPQFEVSAITDAFPTTPEALERFLAKGRFPGIAAGNARRIIKRWGVGAFDILDKTPQALEEVGIESKKIAKIASVWKECRQVFAIVSFLGVHGIGENLALRIRDHLGEENLVGRIRENPYLLTSVDGIGFKRADEVGLSVGIDASDPRRIGAALSYVLQEATQKSGHTALPYEEWLKQSAFYVGQSIEKIKELCDKLITQHKVILRHIPLASSHGPHHTQACVSLPREYWQERFIADKVLRLQDEVKAIPLLDQQKLRLLVEDPERGLDPSQQKATLLALTQGIVCITGGPGTGKTTTLRSVVEIAKTELKWDVILAAPTGRAAKRMQEAIGSDAQTMHRHLKYHPAEGFARNEKNPLEGDLFILDEASMVDTALMAAWLRAMPRGANVLFVGDVDQLPAVGPGDVLRNLIESRALPVARLAHVHRQVAGSAIARTARAVLTGYAPIEDTDPALSECVFMSVPDNQSLRDTLAAQIGRLLQNGVRPMDIQILSPQKGGEVGTEMLNHVFRLLLNPHRPAALPDEGWIPGDRIMQTKNNYEHEVFNGDMGEVLSYDEETGEVVVALDEVKPRTVTFTKPQARSLVLGYAITVHKAQGGERPYVLLPISRSHSFSLHRNLVYTGLTRAKEQAILIGDVRTWHATVKKHDQQRRITGLGFEISNVKAARAPTLPPVSPSTPKQFRPSRG